MEVTIHAERAGLGKDIINSIKRLAPRLLVAHNIERQIALRVDSSPHPLLEVGELVVHADTEEALPDQLCEVVRVDADGRVDLEDHEGEVFESVAFPADLVVFDLAPGGAAPEHDEQEAAA